MKKLHGKIKNLSFTQLIAFVTLFLLLGAIFVTINSTLQQQALRSSAATSTDPVGETNPSFYPLAPCPTCSSPSIAPVSGGAVAPTGGVTNPSYAATNPGQTEPCVANNSIYEDNHKKKHKKHSGKLSEGMESLLELLVKLLELLIQILGGGQIANPVPAPTTPEEPQNPDPVPCEPSVVPPSQPAEVPTTSGTPSQGVAPSTAAGPSQGVAPSGTAGGGNPTDTTCPANTPSSPVTGYKLAKCEDFNGTSTPKGWSLYGGGSGGSTVVGEGRQEKQCVFGNGVVTLKQEASGATCGMSSDFAGKYGYWEARMRAYPTANSEGSAPHPVMLLWPDSGNWSDGELDWVETDIGDDGIGVFFHCTNGDPSQNCYHTTHKVDITQWHTYGFEWTATTLRGFVDGVQIYETDGKGGNPTVSMHQTLQLDNNTGKMPPKPGNMEVDWVHMYTK